VLCSSSTSVSAPSSWTPAVAAIAVETAAATTVSQLQDPATSFQKIAGLIICSKVKNMKTNNEKNDWTEFYKVTRDKPPSKLLVKALEYVKYKNKAIDIGGGALKDTRYLLSLGFDVTVIDDDELMAKEAVKIQPDKLHLVVSSFENFNFPSNQFDIASAMFALPFNPSNTFDKVTKKIKESLVRDGIFCGQLFGIHDSWNTRQNMTFHTKEQAKELLKDMESIYFNEEENDGTTANGTPKHWHIFHFIVRKT